MPLGGASSNSTSASPRGGATAHRRRVADLIPDTEKTTTDSVIASSDDKGDATSHRTYSIAVALVILDDIMIRFLRLVNLRKNMGRRIFGVLIMMVVVLMFIKFSLMLSNTYYNLEMIHGNNKRLNGLFVLSTWHKPSQQTMAVQRDEEKFSLLPKRVSEKYPVSL